MIRPVVKAIPDMSAETARELIIEMLGEERGHQALSQFWEMLSDYTNRVRTSDGTITLNYHDSRAHRLKVLCVKPDSTYELLEEDGDNQIYEEFYPDHTAHRQEFFCNKLIKAEWKKWHDGTLDVVESTVISPDVARKMLSRIGIKSFHPDRTWRCEVSPEGVLYYENYVWGCAYQIDLNDCKMRYRDLDDDYAWTEWQ